MFFCFVLIFLLAFSVINVDNNKNNELEESEDNTQNVRDEVRNFFNDPNDDEFLSQMNIDDF